MRIQSGCRVMGLVVVGLCMLAGVRGHAEDMAKLKATFAQPPCEYASAPLWVWNDMLTEEEVVGTLRDLAGQKVKQAFVHPRPGLMTPYLSDDWFRLWKAALAEAERLDMNLWIYDENSYPSGFGGGFVPKALPDSRAKSLVFGEVKKPGPMGEGTVAVFRLVKDGYENVTEAVRKGETLGEGKYLVASIRYSRSSPWYGGTWYVDLLKPGVTEKFLEVTLEPYRKQVGEQFGKRIPGSFTDEPRLESAGGVPWSEGLPAAFEKRWGYSLVDHLPSLVRPVGDWRRVRHNFMQVVLEQFIEHWSKPYHDYCEKHRLQFTGHYWEHEWPNCGNAPDNMAMYAWHQRPAIDCLMNQYHDDTHAQFGNVRAVRELSSVANQLGMRRTLCEAYGAGGWDLRFEDMKRIGDWLYVLGVNTLDEHLSYITIRGARKNDHPQSFSYHEPWWNDYHVMAEYFTRLSAAMSQGEQINRILILEPTTTAWMYQHGGPQGEKLKQLGDRFEELLVALERAQGEYDLGAEDILSRHGKVDGKDLVIGQRWYGLVALPPMTENLNAATMDLIEKYVENGGKVLCCGEPPALVDGRPSDRGARLAKQPGWQKVEAGELVERIAAVPTGFAIRRDANDQGLLFHRRRQMDGGNEFVLLVNTSLEASSAGVIEATRPGVAGVEQWDLMSGEVKPYRFTTTDHGVETRYALAPGGSLLLMLTTQKRPSAEAAPSKVVSVKPTGEIRVRRAEPNVLTLDYVDFTTKGKTVKDRYYYQAEQMAFQSVGLPRNPWDSAVQFGDELIRQKFPADSGFEATYRFTIDGAVPSPLEFVVERPDLYTITCNGKPVTAKPGAWWLDRAFGRIDLGSTAKSGENEVTIKASPMTMYHELERAYVLGAFSLRPAEKGFVIEAEKALALGPWNAQGCPMYASGVAYTQEFDVAKPSGQYRVKLPSWYGSVAKVAVNGEPAGVIASQPWECDVTKAIRPGKNAVEVVVIGTLKNTLGPHHAGPIRGAAWPGMFHQGPETGPPAGAKYDTIGYGLMEPMVLEAVE